MKRKGVIYKIENKVNGKVYVGQTIRSVKERFKCHKHRLKNNCHENEYLLNAWNRYGEENFKFEIIEYCDIDDIDEREKYWIDFYRKKNGVYNIENGGNFNKDIPKETRVKLSKSVKKLWSDEEYYQKQLENNMRKVICINTGKIYNSIKEAAEDLNVSHAAIYYACVGKRDSVGGYKGKPLQVAYYEEGKEYKLKELKKINAPKKVICVNTKEIFNSMYEAAKKYKKYGCSQSKISMCCNGKRKHAGRLENGEYLIWRFLDDYDPNEKFVITNKVVSSGNKHKVRCITTGEVFNTIKSACDKYNISRSTLWRACTGRLKDGVKLKDGTILKWEYI